jgi:uncharacterized membrane protein YsdA (DUF1294 family)
MKMQYFAYYLSAISIISVVLTIYDKWAAIQHKERVPERTLFSASALGGSFAMLLAMLAFRHKTKHAKFMVGIPVMIVIQIAAAIAVLYQLGVI